MASKTAPPLKKMAKHKAMLEAARDERYGPWKAALENFDGNISHAAIATLAADSTKAELKRATNRGQHLTKSLGLVEYAVSLREKAGVYPRGRPWPKNGISKK